MSEEKNLTLEEKIDQILEYQRSAKNWAMFHAIMNFFFFFILVILPIIGLAFAFKSLMGGMGIDINSLQETLKGLENSGQLQEMIKLYQ